jgi:type I restriction enzyme S subunit
MSEWKEMELGQFVELKRGYDLPKRSREEGVVPLVSSSGKSDVHNVAKVKGPGVVTGRYGTIGQVFYIEEDFWPLNTTLYVKDFKGNDPLFVYYFLKTISYSDYSDKAAVPGINRNHLHKAEIRVPVDPIYQRELAEKLWALDSKIELNRQTNQTLEHMAQAIFKSWFVDFEPTRAKIAAKKQWQAINEITETSSPACNAEELDKTSGKAISLDDAMTQAAMAAISGLSTAAAAGALSQLDQLSPAQQKQLKATADLFPDALVDSELGEIPEGWEVQTLSKMVEIIGGGTPKKSESEFWGGDIPWFSVKDAPADGDVFVIDTDLKITELGLNKSSTKLLPEGVTIISARGTVGRLALVGVPTAMNQSCYGVKGANGIGPYLNYFNLKNAVEMLQQNTHGAVFDTITTSTFDTVCCANSGKGLKDVFDKLVSNNFEKIKNNLFESKELVDIRDSLLPKLLSGDLEITEAG